MIYIKFISYIVNFITIQPEPTTSKNQDIEGNNKPSGLKNFPYHQQAYINKHTDSFFPIRVAKSGQRNIVSSQYLFHKYPKALLFSQNPLLCYVDTIDWDLIFPVMMAKLEELKRSPDLLYNLFLNNAEVDHGQLKLIV